MESRNIWLDVKAPLELHEDVRGKIVDVFFKTQIEHVAVIDSKAGAIRGNHYHKQSVQSMLMTKGSMEYWYKPLDSNEPAKCIVMKIGDLVTTPPYEVHALKFNEDAQFIVFAEGIRGGTNYEKDTFRIEGNIISN